VDPVWLLSAAFTAFELIVTVLLVMPMPSNKFRGSIVNAISHTWHTNDYIRKTAWVMLTLNAYYLYDCVRNLLEYNKVYAASCESRAMVLYLQRNTFISATSVFLFLVMRRLLEIQMMLFSTREAVKDSMMMLGDGSSSGNTSPRGIAAAAAAGGGGDGGVGGGDGGGGGGSSGKSKDMKSVLRKLEREVSTIMREESFSDKDNKKSS